MQGVPPDILRPQQGNILFLIYGPHGLPDSFTSVNTIQLFQAKSGYNRVQLRSSVIAVVVVIVVNQKLGLKTTNGRRDHSQTCGTKALVVTKKVYKLRYS